ncbi:hypothetical protein Sste5346_001929 [Sporothrix stenoceras]|uniref:Uncharacterized protein n=1 Tax=Sporothrix stenoceras TaxID=5173 RepID=A0ABR3ZMN0_9PEZI
MVFSNAADVLYRLERVSEGDINSSNTDTLVVSNVSPTDFQALEAKRKTSEQRYRFSYFADTKAAILTAPTAAHEQMHIALYIHLMDAMCKMEVLDDWQWTASATVRAATGSSGEADTAGSPVHYRQEEGWPTLVVQTGTGSSSQTMHALRQKARWWFTASHRQVKVVLLVSISVQEAKLRIEKWTDQTAEGQQQTIEVSWTGPGPVHQAPLEDRYDPKFFWVEGGPLELKFADLFLRKPKDDEHDIVLSEGDLQDVAVRVWSAI